METLRSQNGFAYWGESEGWGMVYGQHRDSEALERSNFLVIRKDLESRFPEDVRVESFSNWLVGWNETLLVRPDSEAWQAAEVWLEKLADYPVADEEAWSEAESAEALESAAEFVRCELPYTLREHAEDVASFILYAYGNDGRYSDSEWCRPGGWWPTIEKDAPYASPRDVEYHRDTVAAGIRAWRNYSRKSA